MDLVGSRSVQVKGVTDTVLWRQPLPILEDVGAGEDILEYHELEHLVQKKPKKLALDQTLNARLDR